MNHKLDIIGYYLAAMAGICFIGGITVLSTGREDVR
jgi:hypothetical protein